MRINPAYSVALCFRSLCNVRSLCHHDGRCQVHCVNLFRVDSFEIMQQFMARSYERLTPMSALQIGYHSMHRMPQHVHVTCRSARIRRCCSPAAKFLLAPSAPVALSAFRS